MSRAELTKLETALRHLIGRSCIIMIVLSIVLFRVLCLDLGVVCKIPRQGSYRMF